MEIQEATFAIITGWLSPLITVMFWGSPFVLLRYFLFRDRI